MKEMTSHTSLPCSSSTLQSEESEAAGLVWEAEIAVVVWFGWLWWCGWGGRGGVVVVAVVMVMRVVMVAVVIT